MSSKVNVFLEKNLHSVSLTLLLIVFLFQGSSDLYSASMPYMQEAFAATTAQIQFTITLFLICYGLGPFVWLYFSTRYGARRIVLLNLVLFLLSSLLASMSQALWVLYLARALQGLAMSGLNINVKALPMRLFQADPTRVKVFFSYFGLFWGAGGTLAPWIGSNLQYYFGWRANFIFLTIYALVMLILVWVNLPQAPIDKSSSQLRPMVHDFMVTIRCRGFLAGVFAQACSLSLFLAFNYFMSFYVQRVLGKSVLFFGWLSFCIGLSLILGCLSFRILLKRFQSTYICLAASINAFLLALLLLGYYAIGWGNVLVISVIICMIIFLSGIMASENIATTLLYFKDKATVASCSHSSIHFLLAAGLMFLLSSVPQSSMFGFIVGYVVLIGLFLVCNRYCYSHLPR